MGSGSPVIGRESELQELIDRLTDHRLVTVIGPGGIGKTSIAAVVAERMGSRFPDGWHLIDLTRVDDDAGVEATFAAQIGLPSFDALLSSPDDRHALLVVDNCEHVLDAAASVVGRLLEASTGHAVLATSRSPLGLPTESVVVIGPLRVSRRGSYELDSPAEQLFLARARDAGTTVVDAAGVAALCRALDGLPLALEIAAARTPVLSPAEILGHLDDLAVLSRPRHRGDERHQSLRSTIEWSYRHLTPDDQGFFARLAVLAGSFDVGDAHAVDAEPRTLVETVDRLDALVATSLLGTDAGPGGTTRYRQLETVRTFARECLEASGAWEETWQLLLDHLVAWPRTLLRRAAARWDDTIVDSMLARLDSHLHALRWTIVHDDEPGRSFTLVATLWGVVHQGHAEEIGALAETTMSRWPDPDLPGWADAAATTATCRYLLGAPLDAIALAQDAIQHAPVKTFAPTTLRRVVAQSLASLGEVEEAVAALDGAVSKAEEQRLPALSWEMTAFRAELAANLGKVDAGLRAVRRVQREADLAGSEINTIWAMSVEASLLLRVDPSAAIDVARVALERSRVVNYPSCEAVNLHTLAEAAIVDGRFRDAAALLLDLIDGLVSRGAHSELRNGLRTAAVVLQRAGAAGWADLSATAAALPAVSVFGVPGHERLRLPDGDGRVLRARDAVATCRRELGRIVDLADERPPEPDPASDRSAQSSRAGRFVEIGDLWELHWAGETVTLQSSKGMADLARLLASPGREVHCLDLMGAAVEQRSTGDVIDARARREYEQRVRDLQEDIDSAEDDHDHVRADRARAELDAIVDHLTAALSLTGRARRSASSAEKARSAVTQRIRAAVRRVTAAHPDLGRHLEVSIRTGTYCSYQPETATDWQLR